MVSSRDEAFVVDYGRDELQPESFEAWDCLMAFLLMTGSELGYI